MLTSYRLNKYLPVPRGVLFSIFFIAFLFLSCGFAHAALEVKDYPKIPGLVSPSSSCTGNDCLSIFIAYWFGLLVYIAGILALIAFAIGAVSLIMAGDSPTKRSDAIDRIKNASLGLILTLSAFLILRTINPTLITPTLAPLPGVNGVFYTNGRDNKPAPISESNNSNVPQEYRKLIYICKSGPALLVWQFPKENFSDDNGYPNTYVQRMECNNSPIALSGGSFRTAFETPGIYYYLKSGCKGYMSLANVTSGQLDDTFKNNVKSIKIINNIAGGVRYGAIFHGTDDPAKAGVCSLPFVVQDINQSEDCLDNVSVSSSVDIFNWNAKTPELSGQGVDFFSEPWGQSLAARAGKTSLPPKSPWDNKYWNYWYNDAQNISFNYSNVARPNEYKQLYQNFYQHPGSLNIKGNYLVALYKQNGDINSECPKSPWITIYQHMDIKNVNAGQEVKVGDVIGKVGDKDAVIAGPHLHFAVYLEPTSGVVNDSISLNIYSKVSAPVYPGTQRVQPDMGPKALPSNWSQSNINYVLNSLSSPLSNGYCNWANRLGGTSHVGVDYYAQDWSCFDSVESSRGADIHVMSGGPNITSKVIVNTDYFGSILIQHTCDYDKEQQAKNALYCQVFYKDVNNLNETEFIATGNQIGKIGVIPIK